MASPLTLQPVSQYHVPPTPVSREPSAPPLAPIGGDGVFEPAEDRVQSLRRIDQDKTPDQHVSSIYQWLKKKITSILTANPDLRAFVVKVAHTFKDNYPFLLAIAALIAAFGGGLPSILFMGGGFIAGSWAANKRFTVHDRIGDHPYATSDLNAKSSRTESPNGRAALLAGVYLTYLLNVCVGAVGAGFLAGVYFYQRPLTRPASKEMQQNPFQHYRFDPQPQPAAPQVLVADKAE